MTTTPARTITLRTHAGAYARNRMPDAVHALANELPGVVVGTACGRVFAFARTSGLTVDTEPRPITCAACRTATAPAPAARPTRREVPAVDGQLGMTLGSLAERPGSQLDLIAEAGTEVVGPSTLAVPTLF